MRILLTSTFAAFSLVAATVAHADQGPPPRRQQPIVNVPSDEQYPDDRQQPRDDYQYPEQQQDGQQITIINNNYNFGNNSEEYLTPGYGGIPQNFECSVCQVMVLGPGFVQLIALNRGINAVIWRGPAGINGEIINSVIYQAQAQSGLCQRLLPPVFVGGGFGGPGPGGPGILPYPGPRPGFGPGGGFAPRPYFGGGGFQGSGRGPGWGPGIPRPGFGRGGGGRFR